MNNHAHKPPVARQAGTAKTRAVASALVACAMTFSSPIAIPNEGVVQAWADDASDQIEQGASGENSLEDSPALDDKPAESGQNAAGDEGGNGSNGQEKPKPQNPSSSNSAPESSSTEAPQGNPEGETDEASGNTADSYRFSNGMPSNTADSSDEAASELASSATWSKLSSGSWKLTGSSAYIPFGSTYKAKALGIDVSQWNGDINWKSVKAAGIDFAIIRCGWGGNYTRQDDVRFLQNVAGAQKAGVKIGVYLYSYATSTAMAKSEADHTIRLLKKAGLTPNKLAYPVYFDTEDNSTAWLSAAALSSIADTYCSQIKAAGYTPGIYASSGWFFSHLKQSVYSKYDIWVACWSRTCSFSSSYGMWQCLSDGRVPGIAGAVDMNFAYRKPLDAAVAPKTKTYKIRYVLSGGTNAKGNPAKYKNTSKTFKLKNPTRKNYAFKGWYTDKKLTKRIKSVKKGTTGNLKLYAKWQRKGFYVRVTAPVGLLVRTGPGPSYPTAQLYLAQSKLWIIEKKQVGETVWGKLANGTGWICLTHTKPA